MNNVYQDLEQDCLANACSVAPVLLTHFYVYPLFEPLFLYIACLCAVFSKARGISIPKMQLEVANAVPTYLPYLHSLCSLYNLRLNAMYLRITRRTTPAVHKQRLSVPSQHKSHTHKPQEPLTHTAQEEDAVALHAATQYCDACLWVYAL